MLLFLAESCKTIQSGLIVDAIREQGHNVVWAHNPIDTYSIVQRCDGIVINSDNNPDVDNLEHLNIPIYEYPFIPEKYKTEITSPIQCDAFLNQVIRMYHVHLSKNSDYSASNILGTGEVGLVTRLWDKVARLFSLTGFKVKAEFLGFDKPSTPKNESIEDTYDDLAVYAVIGKLLRNNQWGK